MSSEKNLDKRVVNGFGDEWTRFDQSEMSAEETESIFNDYFRVFPWHTITANSVGADFGCGSGRWAKLVASRVGTLYCIDGSRAALEVARRNLRDFPNCRLIEASVGDIPLQDASLDFGYSLGVLHHIPDTRAGLNACVRKLKPGAPFLVYLYYRFDNRPAWFRGLWLLSDVLRRLVSRLPNSLRYFASQIMAGVIYWPLARMARLASRMGVNTESFPLNAYSEKSFYVMRTDALDRFGTRLERRFTRAEIQAMMTESGLERVSFSEASPFWCAVGYRR